MLIALSGEIKEYQQQNAPDFWKHDPDEDKASWTALFKHLLQGRGTLTRPRGYVQIMDDEEGYDRVDLDMWLASWRGDRQTGMKEKGQETQVNMDMAQRTSSLDVDDGVRSEYRGVGSGQEESCIASGSVGNIAAGGTVEDRKRRVSWNDDALVDVREITPPKTRKMKKRKKLLR